MSVEEVTDRPLAFGAPRFSVDVGGSGFTDADGVVSSVSVESTLDGADRFDVTLTSPYDRPEGRFRAFEWDDLSIDAPVTVALGYEAPLTTVLTGRVRTIEPSFPADGGPSVTIGGYDHLHDLMAGERSRSWSERTDTNVVRDVLAEYPALSLEAEDTGVVHPTVVQDAESDYRFLRGRAERNGFELFARGDVVVFRPPAIDTDPTVSLRYGESLRSFSAAVNDTDQVGEVVVRHWDPVAKAEVVGRETRDGGTGTEVIRRPVRSPEEATRLAEATMDRIVGGRLGGRGATVGTTEIRVGEGLELDGLGRFSGTYYVEEVTHRLDESGFSTEFAVAERTP